MISLMYHDVYKESMNESGIQNISSFIYKIDVNCFENQIQIIDEYCNQTNLSRDSIHITFDDGGVSFLTLIAPILEKYNFKGRFFISTKFINTLGFLTSAEILELHRRGHIIGAHSHSHPINMSKLPVQQIYKEWETSIRILSEIVSEEIKIASIPNGAYSNQVTDIIANCGITSLYTSIPIIEKKYMNEMEILGRFGIQNNMSSEYILSIIKSDLVKSKIYYKYFVLKVAKIILGNSYYLIREIILKSKV